MPKKILARLAKAMSQNTLVCFTRLVEPGYCLGYVIDIGSKFFMLAAVDDSIRFNGFQCFQLKSIDSIEAPHRYSKFVEAAIEKRGECRPEHRGVSVESVEQLLLSASREFPLITIHCEKTKPDVCVIGRVVEVRRRKVLLHSIGPDAVWNDRLDKIRLSDITRVDFGGAYEEALYAVASSTPTAA